MRAIIPRPAYRRSAAGSHRIAAGHASRAWAALFAVTASVLAHAAPSAPHIRLPVATHASLPQPDFVISCVSIYPAPPGGSVNAGSDSAGSYPFRATVTVTNIGRGAAVNDLITVAAISGFGDVGVARFRRSFAPGARVNVEFPMSQKQAFFKVQAEKESNTTNDTRNGSPSLSKANTCPAAPLVRVAVPPRRARGIRLAPHTPKLNPQPEPPSKR